MKKTFCDLCMLPAMEGNPTIEIRNPAPRVGVDTQVEVKVLFIFRERPGGFAYPPDLCEACRRMLVEECLDSIAPELPKAKEKKR